MRAMTEALKQAVERAAQQSPEELEALADLINRMIDDDAKWEALFADPLTPQALEMLAAEALAEDDAA